MTKPSLTPEQEALVEAIADRMAAKFADALLAQETRILAAMDERISEAHEARRIARENQRRIEAAGRALLAPTPTNGAGDSWNPGE